MEIRGEHEDAPQKTIKLSQMSIVFDVDQLPDGVTFVMKGTINGVSSPADATYLLERKLGLK